MLRATPCVSAEQRLVEALKRFQWLSEALAHFRRNRIDRLHHAVAIFGDGFALRQIRCPIAQSEALTSDQVLLSEDAR